jgi:hypothetical protein
MWGGSSGLPSTQFCRGVNVLGITFRFSSIAKITLVFRPLTFGSEPGTRKDQTYAQSRARRSSGVVLTFRTRPSIAGGRLCICLHDGPADFFVQAARRSGAPALRPDPSALRSHPIHRACRRPLPDRFPHEQRACRPRFDQRSGVFYLARKSSVGDKPNQKLE